MVNTCPIGWASSLFFYFLYSFTSLLTTMFKPILFTPPCSSTPFLHTCTDNAFQLAICTLCNWTPEKSIILRGLWIFSWLSHYWHTNSFITPWSLVSLYIACVCKHRCDICNEWEYRQKILFHKYERRISKIPPCHIIYSIVYLAFIQTRKLRR